MFTGLEHNIGGHAEVHRAQQFQKLLGSPIGQGLKAMLRDEFEVGAGHKKKVDGCCAKQHEAQAHDQERGPAP